jgi:hypothetical protein
VTGRFAIYAVPGTGPDGTPGTALRQRAEQWLGRSVSGQPVTPAVPAGWTRAAVDAITANARRYGFHATLKAPFRLAEPHAPGELEAALARFAAGHQAIAVPALTLARLGRFYALVPGTPAAPLHTLADAVVTGFDQFRAPPTAAETARRQPDSLTPRQRELLAAWGYPYVLDEFRFHLTVTDQIPPGHQPAVERALTRWFGPDLGATVPVDSLALFTEDAPGAPFALHALHPLQPAPDGASPGRPPAERGRPPAEREGTR